MFLPISEYFSEPSRCLSSSLHTSLWLFIGAIYEVHCGNFWGQCCGQVIRIKFLNNIMMSSIIKLWCTDKRQHAQALSIKSCFQLRKPHDYVMAPNFTIIIFLVSPYTFYLFFWELPESEFGSCSPPLLTWPPHSHFLPVCFHGSRQWVNICWI